MKSWIGGENRRRKKGRKEMGRSVRLKCRDGGPIERGKDKKKRE